MFETEKAEAAEALNYLTSNQFNGPGLIGPCPSAMKYRDKTPQEMKIEVVRFLSALMDRRIAVDGNDLLNKELEALQDFLLKRLKEVL